MNNNRKTAMKQLGGKSSNKPHRSTSQPRLSKFAKVARGVTKT